MLVPCSITLQNQTQCLVSRPHFPQNPVIVVVIRLTPGNGGVNLGDTVGRVLKHMPHLARHALKRLFEPLCHVLGLDADGSNVGDPSDQNQLDPSGVLAGTVVFFCLSAHLKSGCLL